MDGLAGSGVSGRVAVVVGEAGGELGAGLSVGSLFCVMKVECEGVGDVSGGRILWGWVCCESGSRRACNQAWRLSSEQWLGGGGRWDWGTKWCGDTSWLRWTGCF